LSGNLFAMLRRRVETFSMLSWADRLLALEVAWEVARASRLWAWLGMEEAAVVG